MPNAPAVFLDLMRKPSIPAMHPEAIAKVRRLEVENLERDQIRLPVQDTLHGGMYVRTVFIPAGVLLTGALIKVPTVVIVQGSVTVYIGGGSADFEGYNILPASAGRKQAFLAITDTYVSMMFPTKATTVEEAEREFTDEHEQLASRRDNMNVVQITGE